MRHLTNIILWIMILFIACFCMYAYVHGEANEAKYPKQFVYTIEQFDHHEFIVVYSSEFFKTPGSIGITHRPACRYCSGEFDFEGATND